MIKQHIGEDKNLTQMFLKPTFDFSYLTLQAIWLAMPIIVVLFIGVAFHKTFGLVHSLFYLILYAIIASLVILARYPYYLYCSFTLDKDKVSCVSSFINYKRKDIKYEDIKEVVLKIGFVQKLFGLGTISVITNATISKHNPEIQFLYFSVPRAVTEAGINLFNIANPMEVYEILQQKITASKSREASR